VGGVARRATVIKQARRSAPEALVVDAGDSLIGDQTPATTSQGASSVELLNKMGYDALVLGESDLVRLGVDRLAQLASLAQFPLLSANVVFSDTQALPEGVREWVRPYVIQEVGGYSVALIGLTGP
jgi:2',3'-cyclic-nucleotide 2'-phosphodiesterase (5'-nucleotidase family)